MDDDAPCMAYGLTPRQACCIRSCWRAICCITSCISISCFWEAVAALEDAEGLVVGVDVEGVGVEEAAPSAPSAAVAGSFPNLSA